MRVDVDRGSRAESPNPVNSIWMLHGTYAKGFYHVPKKNLIVGLQVLLQKGGLQIPAGLAFHGEFLKRFRRWGEGGVGRPRAVWGVAGGRA